MKKLRLFQFSQYFLSNSAITFLSTWGEYKKWSPRNCVKHSITLGKPNKEQKNDLYLLYNE